MTAQIVSFSVGRPSLVAMPHRLISVKEMPPAEVFATQADFPYLEMPPVEVFATQATFP